MYKRWFLETWTTTQQRVSALPEIPKRVSKLFGEWLPRAQGEDVVAGTHTPRPLNTQSISENQDQNGNEQTLEYCMPEVYSNLVEVQEKLERHYKDMQDIEFTIESGHLYLLQTRNGTPLPQHSDCS